MSDLADRAQEQQEQLENLRKFHRTRPQVVIATNAPRICVDCDEEISLARIKAVPDCIRCKDCQELVEL